MELIERYLQAVAAALPESQRDDIIKELRDNILSQVEEQEHTLGRPLSEDEQIELLKKLGSPARLASRYRKQEYVVGSSTFPIYWKILKLALGLTFLLLAAGSVGLAASGKSFFESLSILLRYPSIALSVFGWITLIFFALEFFVGAKCRLRDEFDPRSLPPLTKKPVTRKSRFELVAKLVMQTVFSVWWLTGLHYQFLIFGPGVVVFNFAPIWNTLYPFFVIAALVDITRTAVMLYNPAWNGLRILKYVNGGIGFAILIILATRTELFVPANSSVETQEIVKNVNFALHLGLMVAIVVRAITFIVEVARLVAKKVGAAHGVSAGTV